MKKILVSVKEFSENGGVLLLERPIFDRHNNQIGEYGGWYDKEMFIVQQVGRSFRGYNDMYFVEIDCTPHYA